MRRRWSRPCRSVVDIAGLTEAEAATALRALRPSGIVTFSERQIPVTATLASLLDLPYHSPDDVGAITRKDEQRRRLRDSGVETLRFQEVVRQADVDAAVAHVGLPAVVKPAAGAASRHTTPVHTGPDCADAVAHVLADAVRCCPSMPPSRFNLEARAGPAPPEAAP